MESQESMNEISIGVILAAGMGKRMNSDLPKVIHMLCGKPLLVWVIESLIEAGITKIVIVISPVQTRIEEIISNYHFSNNIQIKFAYQRIPLGTGDATKCGIDCVEKYFSKEISNYLNKNILIAYGDTPAVQGTTFKKFLEYHSSKENYITILAFQANNPFGYGRIVTDQNGNFIAICEEKDCSEEQKKIKLCNSGFICANYIELKNKLPLIKNNNAAKEYYLTDIPLISKQYGGKIGYMIGDDESEFLGINSQEQLAKMEIKFQEKFSKK